MFWLQNKLHNIIGQGFFKEIRIDFIFKEQGCFSPVKVGFDVEGTYASSLRIKNPTKVCQP